MQERRRQVRMPSYLGGRIAFNQRFSTMDCLVRNISGQGARLKLAAHIALPDRFELEITKRQQSFAALIAWRTREAIGVELEPWATATVIPLEMARRLKVLQDDNAALRRRVAEFEA